MRITFETNNEIGILKISGRMTFDESLFQMRNHIQKALGSGIRTFILDISDVPFMDSSALGELITVYTSIAKAQGLFVMVNPVGWVRALFKRIRLDDIFKIAESVEEAERILRTQLR